MNAAGSTLTTHRDRRIPPFDVARVRRDFPILAQKIHGKPLVYLDNAATTQKPQAVLDAILRYYTQDCSNIHRGVHLLSERATQSYEDSRCRVKRFINAADEKEIIFVRGTTEAINLVSQSYVRKHVASETTAGAVFTKVNIRNEGRDDCLVALNKMNVNHMTLFPDIEGAARHVNSLLQPGHEDSIQYV